MPEALQAVLVAAWFAGLAAVVWRGSIEIVVVAFGWSLVGVAAIYGVSTL